MNPQLTAQTTLRSLRDAIGGRGVIVRSQDPPGHIELLLDRQNPPRRHDRPLRDRPICHPECSSQRAGSASCFKCSRQPLISGTTTASATRGGGGHAKFISNAKAAPQGAAKETDESGGGMVWDMKTTSRITDRNLVIGRRIAAARRNSGLSQSALATMLSLSPGAVTQWETGRAMPTPEKFQHLAEALGVEASWLLTGDEPDEIRRAQTVNEAEALRLIRQMMPGEQSRALQVLEALAGTPRGETKV